MHRAAIPDANPSDLADPDDVAARIVRLLESERVASGSRVEAQTFEAGP
jgi:hypothetical protein